MYACSHSYENPTSVSFDTSTNTVAILLDAREEEVRISTQQIVIIRVILWICDETVSKLRSQRSHGRTIRYGQYRYEILFGDTEFRSANDGT